MIANEPPTKKNVPTVKRLENNNTKSTEQKNVYLIIGSLNITPPSPFFFLIYLH